MLDGAEGSVKVVGLFSEYIGLEMAVELLLRLWISRCQLKVSWTVVSTKKACTAERRPRRRRSAD